MCVDLAKLFVIFMKPMKNRKQQRSDRALAQVKF